LHKNCRKNRKEIIEKIDAKKLKKSRKNCIKRTKIDDKNARQIVEIGVDQVDLVEVQLPETKKRKNFCFFFSFFAPFSTICRAVFLV
jgi:hypothetical protein